MAGEQRRANQHVRRAIDRGSTDASRGIERAQRGFVLTSMSVILPVFVVLLLTLLFMRFVARQL